MEILNMPRMVNAKAVAEMTGTSKRHIYELTKEGRIPHVRVSERCIRYSVADVQRFIDRNKVGGDS